MAKIELKVDGQLSNLDVAGFVNSFADEFIRRVETRTPVRSGALRDGYIKEVSDTSFELGNQQEYLEYIEEGTSTIAPVGMIRTTMEEADIIVELVKGKLTK